MTRSTNFNERSKQSKDPKNQLDNTRYLDKKEIVL
jgi:hypothetical protein